LIGEFTHGSSKNWIFFTVYAWNACPDAAYGRFTSYATDGRWCSCAESVCAITSDAVSGYATSSTYDAATYAATDGATSYAATGSFTTGFKCS
tara:strand:- start:173 stop:451 length:279 start_codon:yes stop_codon:yes gene_type:complete